jgi:lipopolysaccharide export system permease protein
VGNAEVANQSAIESCKLKTLRRLIIGELIRSVLFVTIGFLSLFSFFDFVDQLQSIGRPNALGYKLPQALTYVALLIPSHLYELLPITVLIGTIFVMARFAQSSEFTILRTSGLGPWRALQTLLAAGAGFVVITFAVGDYVAPLADKAAQLLKARFDGNLTIGRTGAWLKEKQRYSQFAANVGAIAPDGQMQGIRIFEFDNQGRVVSLTHAESGKFARDSAWLLQNANRTEFATDVGGSQRIEKSYAAEFRWPTEISAEMVSTAVLKPERMGTIDLFQYIRHLDANGQTAQRYEIEFWKKVFYPLSCLVMVVLALPFAYLHFRSEGISVYVFGGVMAGISFFFLNNVSGYVGEIQHWQPWLTAALPGMVYSMLSLGAFVWLVLKR